MTQATEQANLDQPVVPPRRTQADRSEDTQRKIIRATIRLLKSKGYAGVRSAAVADTAEVSRGGLMHHFENKDSLVLAAVEDILMRSRQRALHNIRKAQTSDDPIAAIAADARSFFFSEDFAVVLDLTLMSGKNAEFQSHIRRFAEVHRAPVERAWEALLVQHGLSQQQAGRMLSLTLSIVRGLSIRALRVNDPEYFDDLLQTWQDMVRSYLRQNSE